MKIGVFNVAFPYKNPLTNEIISETGVGGGVENIVYMLTVKMAEQGHELHVFSSSENKKESTETYEKIVVYRYKKNFEIGTSPVSLNLLFKPLMMKRDLDIVHAHMVNLPAPLVAYWYAKKIKKPFVITYHGEYVYGFGGPVRTIGVFLYHLYFANKLLKNADAIIVLSENVINESKLLTKYRDKIKVIPNGINLEEFEISLSKEKCREHLNLPQDKNIILFVGSLTHIKAPDVLLNAMKLVIDKIPETYLVLVGSGQMQTELEI
jgi:glycosyltransferase involved in cell wall biosynthesis